MLYKLVCALCIVAASAFNAPAASKFGLAAAPAVRAVRAAPMVVMEEVEDKVKAIIAEQLGVEASSVLPGSSFTEDLGADSLDAVELIMAIEEVRPPRAERQRQRQHTHTLWAGRTLLHRAMEAGRLQQWAASLHATERCHAADNCCIFWSMEPCRFASEMPRVPVVTRDAFVRSPSVGSVVRRSGCACGAPHTNGRAGPHVVSHPAAAASLQQQQQRRHACDPAVIPARRWLTRPAPHTNVRARRPSTLRSPTRRPRR